MLRDSDDGLGRASAEAIAALPDWGSRARGVDVPIWPKHDPQREAFSAGFHRAFCAPDDRTLALPVSADVARGDRRRRGHPCLLSSYRPGVTRRDLAFQQTLPALLDRVKGHSRGTPCGRCRVGRTSAVASCIRARTDRSSPRSFRSLDLPAAPEHIRLGESGAAARLPPDLKRSTQLP